MSRSAVLALGSLVGATVAAVASRARRPRSIRLDGAADRSRVALTIRWVFDVSLEDAEALVDAAPCVLREGVPDTHARRIKVTLEKQGARISLV